MRSANFWVRSSIAALILCSVGLSACESPQQKVRDERREAAKEVAKAQSDADRTAADAQRKVDQAQPDKKADAKVEATEDIAAAKKKVEDEKVEATKEVTAAEQNAGQGGTYTKQ